MKTCRGSSFFTVGYESSLKGKTAADPAATTALAMTHLQVYPSDERIAAVILEIADFMLEFSTLGHEEAADIPQFVHPRIPNEVHAKGHRLVCACLQASLLVLQKPFALMQAKTSTHM